MTFTYSGDPNVSDRDKVRFIIGDTDSTAPHLQDAEIEWMLIQWSNDVYETSRNACDILAGRYAHKANYSKTVGDLSISEQFQHQADQFHKLGERILAQRMRLNPPAPVVNANALVSTENRNVDTYNTDAYLGIHDYDKGQNPK